MILCCQFLGLGLYNPLCQPNYNRDNSFECINDVCHNTIYCFNYANQK